MLINAYILGISKLHIERPILLDVCQRGMCAQGATCVATNDGFACVCPKGRTGKTCQKGRFLRVTFFVIMCYHYPTNLRI